ncbi:MAG TPA: hypothetical protein VFB54_08765 [Burkholderiales bacterium]|nr:hypothetical protein [Burkholderiales bacterium]
MVSGGKPLHGPAVRATRSALLAMLTLFALSSCVDLAAVQAEAERGPLQGTRALGAVSLHPVQQIDAARLAPRVDETGLPLPGPGNAPLQRLLRPSAVALRGADVYVVDSGLARVLHILSGNQMMHALQGAPAQVGVRVRTGSDRSAYVLDPLQRRVLRFAPNGRLVQTLAAPSEILGRPGALTIDERRGVVVIVDVSFNQLVVMPLLGGSAYPLLTKSREALPSLVGVAAGADGYYTIDAICHCVTLFASNGVVLATFGNDTLIAPLAIGVDQDERVYVADRADNSIKVYSAGRQVGVATGAKLGVTEITDIDVDQGMLAVADGIGARVVLARIAVAPRAAEAR